MSQPPTEARVGRAYLAEARLRLAAAHDRIKHCLAQLDDVQVWWRPQESMNSVANLVLHLCGNLRQWLVAGVGGAADVRIRPQEFAEREPIPRNELQRRLAAAVDEANTALSQCDESRLLDRRRIQGFDETVLSAVFNCLTHLSGHAQEIVYITRLQLRDGYVFAWVPSGPDQGAAPPQAPGGETTASRDAVFEEMPGRPLDAETSKVRNDAPAATAEPGDLPAEELPVKDYLLSLEEEFQEEEEEGKL